jgi:hypothetical protein
MLQQKNMSTLQKTYSPPSTRQISEPTLQLITKGQKIWILHALYCLIAIIIFKIATSDVSFLTMISTFLIAAATLFPSYLWCSDQAKGLPLFPLLAFSYLPTHALPLIANDPKIIKYSEIQHFNAALFTATFLLCATIIWIKFVQKEFLMPRNLKIFKPDKLENFLIISLAFCIIFYIGTYTGIWARNLPNEIVSASNVGIPGLTSLGIVILGYQMGAKKMTWVGQKIFIFLMFLLIYVSAVSIYLNIPGIFIVLACIGWTLGAGKAPWRILIIVCLMIAFFNLGKGETRKLYWHPGAALHLEEYPALYNDWFSNSLKKLQSPTVLFDPTQEGTVTNRSGNLELLLRVMKQTGTKYPYLNGKTYQIIPELIVPRFINSHKIRGAEGNHILSVHYKLKTYKQTFSTSIGWGILQESYANFGWFGCIGLGTLIGLLYGWVSRWSMNAPTISYRFLVATIFVVLGIKTEITAGTFISIISSNLILLLIIRRFLMQTYKHDFLPRYYKANVQ